MHATAGATCHSENLREDATSTPQKKAEKGAYRSTNRNHKERILPCTIWDCNCTQLLLREKKEYLNGDIDEYKLKDRYLLIAYRHKCKAVCVYKCTYFQTN